jgi:tetratricopeptide (TPR) repeat protein
MSNLSSSSRRLLAIVPILLAIVLGAKWYYLTYLPKQMEQRLHDAKIPELIKLAKDDPANPRIFYYLGLRFQERYQTEPAWRALQQAAKLAPESEEIIVAAANSSTQMGNDQEAFNILNAYLQRYPNSAKAHLALAALYHANEGDVGAYREATAATKITPNDPKAWRMLGTAALFATRESEAEPAFTKAIALDPKDWRAELGLGDTLHILKRDQESVPHYRKALAMAPPEGESGIVMGMGRALLGAAIEPAEVAEAVKVLERAVQLNPAEPKVRMALGEGLMRQSRWKEAERALLDAERGLPDLPEVHYDLIKLYRRTGNEAAANREALLQEAAIKYKMKIEDLLSRSGQKGNEVSNGLAVARLQRGHGEYLKAMQQYRSVLKFAPENADAQRELAALEKDHPNLVVHSIKAHLTDSAALAQALRDANDALERSDYPEAEQLYRNVVDMDPNSGPAQQGLAVALYSQGKREQAFGPASRAVSIDATLPEAQYTMAQIYFRSGLQDEAAKRLEKLVEQYPNEPKYAHALGSCYSSNSLRYGEAEKWLAKASDLSPGDPALLTELADVQARMKHIADADKNYRKAASMAPDEPAIISRFGEFLADNSPNAADAAHAEELLNKSLAQVPDDPMALLALGRLRFQAGDFKAAITHMTAATKKAPKLADAWYALGMAYRRAGDAAHANACFQTNKHVVDQADAVSKAEEQARLHMKDPKAILQLARIYAQDGQAAKALNQYDFCLYLDKSNDKVKKEKAGYEAFLKSRNAMPDMSTFNAMLNAATQKAHG